MKIKNIKKMGKNPVYDITVENNNSYVLENGVISHNTGALYSASTVIIVGGKTQEKNTKGDLLGYTFKLNIHKSRYVKEKSQIPVYVAFDGGVDKYSGLLDLALDGGFLDRAGKSKLSYKYTISEIDTKTGEVKEILTKKLKELDDEFWNTLFEKTDFKKYIEEKFKVANGKLLASGKE